MEAKTYGDTLHIVKGCHGTQNMASLEIKTMLTLIVAASNMKFKILNLSI